MVLSTANISNSCSTLINIGSIIFVYVSNNFIRFKATATAATATTTAAAATTATATATATATKRGELG